VVVHHRAADPTSPAPSEPALVGFVVGRTVGPSVDRHRVIRRLRHAVLPTVDTLPPGSVTVIRALPTAVHASWRSLVADVTAGIDRVQRARAGVQ
jgi:ribonuclease P protein component